VDQVVNISLFHEDHARSLIQHIWAQATIEHRQGASATAAFTKAKQACSNLLRQLTRDKREETTPIRALKKRLD
jgi:hypothetical protein